MGENTGGVDRISDLPPFIIHQIMSYLSIKEVAQTSILSKKWNYFRISFPILDFSETNFFGTELEAEMENNERFWERLESFIRFVDVSVLRFCELKLCMQAFRLSISFAVVLGLPSFLDKWVRLAVENEVKELDLNLKTDTNHLYTVPQELFSAKLVTTLKLCGCKLEQPSDTLRLCFLKKLTLYNVHIQEQMVQKLTSECSLLEELFFIFCWGLKCYCISKPLKLRIMRIYSPPNEVERIKISVPSLQEFTLLFDRQQKSCVIDMAECPHLSDLHLGGALLKDQEFHYLFSKFPLLENLRVECCHFLEKVTVASNRLKKLSFGGCGNLKEIYVDTPNLLSFSYVNNPIPISSTNAPCPWKVGFINGGDPDTQWYLNLKEFLGVSNQIEDLILYFTSKKNFFNLEEFQKSSPSLPCMVGNLSLYTNVLLPTNYAALLDGILCVCYPKSLSVITWGKDQNNFIEWLYDQLTNKYVNCCNSNHIKCWRHYLNYFDVESFLKLEDEKPMSIHNLKEVLPILPQGTLRFRLDWCFPVLAVKA